MNQNKDKAKNKKVTKIAVTILTVIAMVLMAPLKTFAVGSIGFAVSKSNISLAVGSSETVTVTKTSGVGKIDVSSSNANVASVDQNAIFVDDAVSIEITAVAVGSANITLTTTDEFADFETEEILEGQTATIKVTVTDGLTASDDSMTPDDSTDSEGPTDEDNDGSVAVPTTAGSRNGTSAPDTGENTNNDKGVVGVLAYLLPILSAVLASSILLRKRNKAHRKFDW